MKIDVVIIGGGIMGSSAAYYLSKHGMHALVLEKEAGAGLQASGRNGGGVRQQGRKAILPLSMEAVRLWANLSNELQCDLEYSRTGNLNLTLDEPVVEAYEREMLREHQNGLKEVRLLTGKQCRDLVPGLSDQVIAGKYCPTDGIANPMLVTPAFVRAGMKLGARYRYNSKVTALLTQGSKVCGVKTEVEEIEASYVINAAGPWAAQFNAQVGCLTPIYPGRSQIMITERQNYQQVRLWLSVRGFGYIRPTRSGNILMGTAGAENDAYSTHTRFKTMHEQAYYWGKFLPWLRDSQVIRSFSGITEYTPDGEPYIGAVPGAPGLLVAAGFHAEGFCPGPMVGKILAEMILGQEPAITLEKFRPDRFSNELKNGKTQAPFVYPLDKMFSAYKSKIMTHAY